MRRTRSAWLLALGMLSLALSAALPHAASGPPPPPLHDVAPPPAGALVAPGELSTDVRSDKRTSVPSSFRLSVVPSVDSNGNTAGPLGPNFPIANFQDATGPTTDPGHPVLAFNTRRGTWLVVWHAYLRVGGYNLYAREVGITGAMPTAAITVCATAGGQYDPALAYDAANDQYWLAWRDERSGTPQVYARRLASTGAPQGNEILVSSAKGYNPRLTCSGQRCLIVFTTDDGTLSWIQARALDATGNPASAVVDVTPASGRADRPDVAYNSLDNQFLAVWQQWQSDTGWDVAARVLSPDLATPGAVNVLCSQPEDQQRPSVAFHVGRTLYGVVWTDHRNGANTDLFCQILGRDGAPLGANFLAYAGPYDDLEPHITAHATRDQFMIVCTALVAANGLPSIRACTVTTGGAATGSVKVLEADNYRSAPQVAPRAGSDEYLVVWRENRTNAQPDIAAQRLRQDRVLSGGVLVVTAGRKGQEVPAVAYNAKNNRFLAAWRDYHPGNDYEIRGRVVGPDGALLGQEVVISRRGTLRNFPWVASLPERDDFLVVYLAATNNLDVAAQRVNAAGQLAGTEIVVSRDTPSYGGGWPHIAANPARNEYLVAWTAFTAGGWDVHAQLLSAEGALLGRNLDVCVAAGTESLAYVTYCPPRNEYLVTWLEYRNSNAGEVYGQRISAEGALLGGELVLASANLQIESQRVVWNEQASEYLLVWGDTVGAGRVFGRRLDASATPLGGQFAITAPEWGAYWPALGYDRLTHEYLLSWTAEGATTDEDVWAARLGADGLVRGAPFGVSVREEIQTRKDLAQDTQSGAFLLVWQDASSGTWDVYGQRWINPALPTPTSGPTSSPTPTLTPTRTLTPGTPTATPTPTRTFVVRARAYLPIIRRPGP
jgi:hypothetical protein